MSKNRMDTEQVAAMKPDSDKQRNSIPAAAEEEHGGLISASSKRGNRKITKSDLKKRFRPDEFIAEKLVTAIAFVSLATIALIFVFVFREAAPILKGPD